MAMRWILTLLAMIAGSAPQEGWTLSMGQLETMSALGQPFHAQIKLQKSERDELDSSCVKLGKGNRQDDLPVLTRAEVTLISIGSGDVLSIRSRYSINEPAMRVIIDIGCQHNIRREYVVLLDPPEIRPQYVPAEAKKRVPPAEVVLIEKESSAYIVREGDTLEGILSFLSVRLGKPQRSLALELLRLNPHLRSEDSGLVVIKPGMVVRLPEEKVSPSVSVQPVSVQSESQLEKRRTKPGRIKAPSGRSSQDKGGLDLKVTLEILDVTLIDRTGVEERASLRAAWQQLKDGESALTSQLEKERKSLEAMQQRIASLAKEIEDHKAAQAVVPVEKPVAPITIPSRQGSSEPNRAWTMNVLYLGILVSICALVIIIIVKRVRSPRQEEPAVTKTKSPNIANRPLEENAEMSSPPSVITQPGPMIDPPIMRGKADIASQDIGGKADIEPQDMGRNAGIEVNEFESIADEAKFFLDIGRPTQAADLIQRHAGQDKKVKVQSWLGVVNACKMLELEDEYARMVESLRPSYNLAAPAAKQKGASPQALPIQSLESFDRIIKNIQQLWGTNECYEYIIHLLHDNRDGTRIGFSLEVFTELMFLADVLEIILGLPQGDSLDNLTSIMELPPDSWILDNWNQGSTEGAAKTGDELKLESNNTFHEQSKSSHDQSAELEGGSSTDSEVEKPSTSALSGKPGDEAKLSGRDNITSLQSVRGGRK